MLKYLKNHVLGSVIASLIVLALTTGGTYFLGLWPSISAGLSGAWGYATSTTLIVTWLFWVMAFCTLLVVLALCAVAWFTAFPPKRGPFGPTYRDYVMDEFFGVRWRWRMVDDGPWGVTAFCPQCDLQVLAADSAYGSRSLFECADCHWQHEVDCVPEGLERLVTLKVQKNLRNGDWE